ncbi:uncharacterized protein LOC112127013 [Cimex lectularius]|uniref:Uncharacterized protein n=1 Tax=Cimex lectularius TaxID=79782 RepID=A0A8I6SJH9_CIMLE|nr:uncharacterized protein LOC112127013 [Cimex lectularius]
MKLFKILLLRMRGITEEPKSGRPVLNDDELREAIELDTSQTLHKLPRVFNVDNETIRPDLHRPGRTWTLSKWVPQKLPNDRHCRIFQKSTQVNCNEYLLPWPRNNLLS